MKWLLQINSRFAPFALWMGVLLLAQSPAQSAAQMPPADESRLAVVHSVRALPEHDGPAVEIVSTRPVTPTISKLENPARLVIDLPNARVARNAKRINCHTTEIEDIRFSQLQEHPPIARIVVDLVKPAAYSWETAGNLLLIRFGTAEVAAKPGMTAGMQPVVERMNSAGTGGATLDGNRVAAGSSVTAGSDAAVIRLGRGGEVRVCPGTTVSVTPSQNNRSLMLGMSTGALETHYALDASADSIMTPDFRILLNGPGDFDYAISADARGNTCIQALPGNTASVIVSELLGDGTYQVKPTEQVVLRSGQLKNVSLSAPGGCGCPAAARPVVLASSAPAASAMKSPSVNVASSMPEALPRVLPSSGSENAALPPSSSKDIHVQVDAPFVFRGDDPTPALPPMVEVQVLPLRSPTPAEPVEATVLAPAQIKEHHGLFGKLRGFFAAIFG